MLHGSRTRRTVNAISGSLNRCVLFYVHEKPWPKHIKYRQREVANQIDKNLICHVHCSYGLKMEKLQNEKCTINFRVFEWLRSPFTYTERLWPKHIKYRLWQPADPTYTNWICHVHRTVRERKRVQKEKGKSDLGSVEWLYHVHCTVWERNGAKREW